MIGRPWALIAALAASILLLCGGMLTACLGGIATAGCIAAPTTAASPASADDAGTTGFDQAQRDNAAMIGAEGANRQIPARGWVIAVATAMQESSLYNRANRSLPESERLPHQGSGADHDSLGLFQQRPSQGWGTIAQLMDPAYAAGKFYTKLTAVDGWQGMALTDAAQKVQVSAYPDAYAKHEPAATALVTDLALTAGLAIAACEPVGAGGWIQPVHAPVVSGFRTADRPGHNGVDLGAPRGTTVVAASAGVIQRVLCDIEPVSWGCDRDGNLSTPGCGWYVDILHSGQIITRYCHLGTRPLVTVGQQVTAGQPLGVVGSSGHSTGPHLHFEVHRNGDPTRTGAVPPQGFMTSVGAALG